MQRSVWWSRVPLHHVPPVVPTPRVSRISVSSLLIKAGQACPRVHASKPSHASVHTRARTFATSFAVNSLSRNDTASVATV